MLRNVAGIACGAVLAIANISATSASPTAAAMHEGGYALAPFSFVKFCLDYPSDCPNSAGPGRIHLTSAHMAELAIVNRAVNAAIRPTPDTSALRFWRLNVSAGDCNSYAVAKRHELIRRGWPAAALALTVAKTSWGEGHLVVTVRTDQGDLVLDNLRSTIIAWQKTGYHWIMRQSEVNPQFWVDLDGGEAGTMTAAADFGAVTELAEADATSPVVDDAPQARRQVVIARLVAADAEMRRASVARLAPVQTAKADAPMPPLRQAVKATIVTADIDFTQADALRSPDVASLEADVASAALQQASRLATTTVDLGFAPEKVPRSPDVASLEAEATIATLELPESQLTQVSDPPVSAVPRWIADAGHGAATIADRLLAALDRWFTAGETTSSRPAPEAAPEAAAADPADLGLRGFI